LPRAGTAIGTGFGTMNAFLASDFDNDRRTDLLTRRTSTGELLLFANNGNPRAPFTGAGTVIGTGWNDLLLG
jgi:hypothetical protein